MIITTPAERIYIEQGLIDFFQHAIKLESCISFRIFYSLITTDQFGKL